MSSGAVGKFQDHYIVLGVDINADTETIHACYSKLAQKYQPGNAETGNKERFDQVNQAYEVLADPALRAEFDKVKGVDREAGDPKFSGAPFFDVLGQSALLRSTVLCLLYDRMRVKSFKPTLSMRHLEAMLLIKGEDLNFALWYLKKRALVINDDKSALAITVEGMDYLEQNRPNEIEVMAMIKPECVVKSELKGATEKRQAESAPVLSALNRALQRR